MRYRILIIFVLFPMYLLRAQNERQDTSIIKKRGDYFTKTKEKINEISHILDDKDTTYISPNKYNLAFMLENSNWYEYYRFKTSEDKPQSMTIAPNMHYKLGVYFGWKWIFLGWSIDLKDLFAKEKGSNKKTEIGFSLYSSKLGGDIYFRKSGSDFKLRSTTGIFSKQSTRYDQNIDGFSVNIKGVNAYWVFNHQKFSYPAAFSQSTNQRRSVGSLIAGFSYSQHEINLDYEKLPTDVSSRLSDALKFKEINYSDYSLSFGYAYNWVFARNCLVAISITPALAYKKSRLDTEEKDFPTLKKINFDVISRAGIVYNNSKYFVGASLVIHTYDYKSKNFYLNNSFGTIRIYAGFNFKKKKEYR